MRRSRAKITQPGRKKATPKRPKPVQTGRKRARNVNASRTFLLVWKRFGVKGSDICHEYRFHPSRRWRFDIAFPSRKLAVELEGRGRHQTVVGYRNDCEKYNAAIELGWTVLRYPVADLNKIHDWIEQIGRVLCGVAPDA
jgi:very-short-patch-repair endonuclease